MGEIERLSKKMLHRVIFLLVVLVGGLLGSECPHPTFLESHICDTCTNTKDVLRFQESIGAKGVTVVFGPPQHSFPPLFRQTGLHESEPCINRQPRAAYRCNMYAKKKYFSSWVVSAMGSTAPPQATP